MNREEDDHKRHLGYKRIALIALRSPRRSIASPSMQRLPIGPIIRDRIAHSKSHESIAVLGLGIQGTELSYLNINHLRKEQDTRQPKYMNTKVKRM